MATFISRPRRRSRRPRRGIFPGRRTSSSSRSMRAARGRRSATSRRAAAISSRISTRPLDLAAVLSVTPLPLGADGRHRFPDDLGMSLPWRAAAAASLRARSGDGASALDQGVAMRSPSAAGSRAPGTPAAAPRPRFPQSLRHGRRLRQERRGARRAPRARLRLRRGRHRDAATAARQPAPRVFRLVRDGRIDQPPRLPERGPRGGLSPARGTRSAGASSG